MSDREEPRNVVIGLTGQSGAGKSTVSWMLRERGYRVIDADVVARQVVEKGKRCLMDLVLEFGVEILHKDGTLNRRKLGAIAFADEKKRMRLNRITFPYIQAAILEQIQADQESGESVIFLDAPTLFESGSDRFCDKVVSVLAPDDIRLARILERDSISEEEARNRMASQHEDAYYADRSDFLIRNGDDMTHLRVQVMEMLEYCCQGIRHPGPDEREKPG